MFLEFRIALPREAVSVPIVRHLCRDALEGLGVTDPCVGDLELALAEACSNVLKHAETAKTDYEVIIKVEDLNCTIEVCDAGEVPGDEWLQRPAPELEAEGGRGVHMMQALVDDLRFIVRPKVGTIVHLEKTLECGENSVLKGLVAAAQTG